jgi:hypothetical protein
VVYASSSSALATGSGLIFDGSGNLGIGATSINSYSKLQIAGGGSGAIGALRFSDVGLTNYWDIGRDNGVGGTFTFTINGSEKARFSIDGNLGIGTSSPVAKLDVENTSAQPFGTAAQLNAVFKGSVSIGQGGAIGFDYFGSHTNCPTSIGYAIESQAGSTNGSLVFGTRSVTTDTAPTERMRIDSAGNVGIGTSSPTTKLEVNGNVFKIYDQSTSNANLVVRNSTTGNAAGFNLQQDGVNSLFYNSSNGYMAFATNATERARIDSSGNLLINKTTTDFGTNGVSFIVGGAMETVGSTNRISAKRTTDGNVIEFYQTTNVGTISITSTATAYNTSSDYRLKNTIAPMTGALAKVALLKPCTYKWNVNGSDGEGFIAHELAEVVPHAVTGAKDAVDADGNPVHQAIDVSFLVATLTSAIQELKAEFDAYKASHP